MFCAVLCTTVVHNDMHTREQFLKISVGLGLVIVHLFRFSILCVFLVQLRLFCSYVVMVALCNRADHYIFILFLSSFFFFLA